MNAAPTSTSSPEAQSGHAVHAGPSGDLGDRHHGGHAHASHPADDGKQSLDDIPAGARALARLNASRRRLRHELLPEPYVPAEGDSSGAPLPRRLRAMFRHWRHKMRHSPLGGVALTAIQTWWHEHPLRVPGEALSNELRGAVGPLVRRHPVATVLLASAAGAALVAWRPWRWPVVARQFKPLPRSFGRWVMAQLSQPAVQSVLAAWLMSTMGRRSAADSEMDSEPDSETDDGTRSSMGDGIDDGLRRGMDADMGVGVGAGADRPASSTTGASARATPASPIPAQPSAGMSDGSTSPASVTPRSGAASPHRPAAQADAGIPADA